MAFRVNPAVDDLEYERHYPAVRHYIATQREKGLIFEIDNILVDADQLVLRTFQCNSGYCVKCSGEAATKSYKGSCCTDLAVDITPIEKERITELARLANARLQIRPGEPIRAIIDNVLADKVTEVNGDHELLFRHKKNGTCAMSWMDPAGQLRCGINTMAFRLGVPLENFKPSPCFLFPLHYMEYDRDRLIVSLLSEETRHWVKHHKHVTRLRCLSRPERGAPPAYQSLQFEIEYTFNKEFYAEIDRRARPLLEKAASESAASNGHKTKAG